MSKQQHKQRNKRFIFLIFLFLLIIGVGGATGDVLAQQGQGQARIPQQVSQAVQQNGQARVILSLRQDNNGPRGKMTPEQVLELQNTVLADLAPRGFEMRRQYQTIPAMAGTINANALRAIERNPHITSVTPDLTMEKHGNNGRDVVGVIAAHSGGFTGEGVTVAVVDTGIAPEAGAMYNGISDAIIGEACFTQQNCYPLDDFTGTSAQDGDGDLNTADFTGHGTVVTDIITGPQGYAPDSDIVAVRVLDDAGGGFLSDWVAGLDWVSAHYLDYGIDVVNMSLGTILTFPEYESSVGSGVFGCEFADPTNTEPNVLVGNDLILDVVDIVDELRDNRVPIFVSSGNQGSFTQTPLPACLSGVISVAATYVGDIGRFPTYPKTYADEGVGFPACFDQVTSETTIACFSSGPADIAAPGVHTVDLAGGGTAIIAGTSYASPAAAGIAALWKQGATYLNTGAPGSSTNSVESLIADMTATGIDTHYNYSGEMTPKLINANHLIFGDKENPGILTECGIEVAAGDVYSASGLVNAINTAKTTGQTICLAAGSTYTLVAKVGNAGLPDIDSTVRINGRGATITRSSTATPFRHFYVSSGWLTLHNVILSNGLDDSGDGGGAILVNEIVDEFAVPPTTTAAYVWLDGVTLRNNQATNGGDGGAVNFIGGNGYVYAIGSRFENNKADVDGGAVAVSDKIVDLTTENARVFIYFTMLQGNIAGGNGGAIYHSNENALMRTYGSAFRDNLASNSGGAIYRDNNTSKDNFWIYNTRFEHNIAEAYGGAIYHSGGGGGKIEKSDFVLNSATNQGGVLWMKDVEYSVSESTFINNLATSGGSEGGVFYLENNFAYDLTDPGNPDPGNPHLTLETSSFEGNSAGYGGVLYTNGAFSTIDTSTFTGNIAAQQGHVFDDDNTNLNRMEVVNSTFATNDTAFFGQYLAAIDNTDFDISYSTLVDNDELYTGASGNLRIKDSLVVGTQCAGTGTITPSYRVYSETGNATCSGTQFAREQFALGGLTDNGGPTRTIAIGAKSIAIGKTLTFNWWWGYEFTVSPDCHDLNGDLLQAGTTPTVSKDQRGEVRDSACDVGAFEYKFPEPQNDFVSVVNSGEVVKQFDKYQFVGKPENDTSDSGEPAGCLGNIGATPGDANDSQHLAVSGTSIFRGLSAGTSIFRGLSAGQSIFRGLASGSVFMEINTTGSGTGLNSNTIYNSSVGVYKNNEIDANEKACLNGKGKVLFEIPGGDADKELPYYVVLWRDAASNDPNDVYALEITDITYKGCASVDGIPPLECEALVQIFYDGDGENWGIVTSNSNLQPDRPFWLDTDRPCGPANPGASTPHELGGWEGVSCSNGHVSGIDLTNISNVDKSEWEISGVMYTDPFVYYQALLNLSLQDSGVVVTTVNMNPLAKGTVQPDNTFDVATDLTDPDYWKLTAVSTPDNLCSLHEAIYYLQDRLVYATSIDPDGTIHTTTTAPQGECQAPATDPNTRLITLGKNRVYEMLTYDSTRYYWQSGVPKPVGNNGLPVIDSDITINGNGARIQRSTVEGTPEFRIISVAGGHLTLNNVIIRNGSVASAGDWGGGIHVMRDNDPAPSIPTSNDGELTITNSQILSNDAESGGGIYIESTNAASPVFEVTGSLIARNRVLDRGGGIFSAYSMTVENSLITFNQAANTAGGIQASNLTMTNTTISRNISGLTGGGIVTSGTLKHVTIADNVTAPGGGALVGSPTVEAILFANNTGGNCNASVGGTSSGYNISDDDTCTMLISEDDLNSIETIIGPLTRVHADDITLVHTLLPGSPALDRIPDASCSVLTDQLGTARKESETRTACDVGAFEHVNRAPVAVADSYETDYNTVLAVSAANGVLANDTDPDQNPLQVNEPTLIAAPTHAQEFDIKANGSFTYRPAVDFHGQSDSFTYQTSDGATLSQIVTVRIDVGPLPDLPPENLSVVEADLETGIIADFTPPVFPTLRWTHRLTLEDTQVPGKWYQIIMQNSQGQQILKTWLDAKVYCSGLTCLVPLGEATTPNAEPILPKSGLVNGDYKFWVRAWYGPHQFSAWSSPGTFSMQLAKPAKPAMNVDVDTWRPLVEWWHPVLEGDLKVVDPYALFYQVRIRTAAGVEIQKKWYPVQDVCNENSVNFDPTETVDRICSIYPSGSPKGGNYVAEVVAWGPGGVNDGGAATFAFSLPTQPPDQVVVDKVIPSLQAPSGNIPEDFTGTLYVNTGQPTFVWSPAQRATWYNVVALSVTTGLKHQAWLLGTDICNYVIDGVQKCMATPKFSLKNDNWTWLVRAWGPGGFNLGNPDLWSQGNFTVQVDPPTGPVNSISPGLELPDVDNISTLIPVLKWERVEHAVWYKLYLGTADGTVIMNKWISDDDLGCHIHENEDSVDNVDYVKFYGIGNPVINDFCLFQVDPLVLKPEVQYKWGVRAWTPGGTSEWSPIRHFIIQ